VPTVVLLAVFLPAGSQGGSHQWGQVCGAQAFWLTTAAGLSMSREQGLRLSYGSFFVFVAVAIWGIPVVAVSCWSAAGHHPWCKRVSYADYPFSPPIQQEWRRSKLLLIPRSTALLCCTCAAARRVVCGLHKRYVFDECCNARCHLAFGFICYVALRGTLCSQAPPAAQPGHWVVVLKGLERDATDGPIS